MKDISAIILTYNEQVHLERCIRSLKPVAKNIFVIDSHSTDETRRIAASLGAVVLEHDWVNYATQLNWALDHCDIGTEWVLRIDADEYLTDELAAEIENRLDELPAEVAGVALRRRVIFMERWMHYGTMYPTMLLRLWRRGRGRCEQRWMDEHIRLTDGQIVSFRGDLVDENLQNLTWWINKHNGYATREAIDLLTQRHLAKDDPARTHERFNTTNRQAGRQRWLKSNIYYGLPIFCRAWFYFLYRYVLRVGFLDGYPGMVFHLMQGLWYRSLVDAKISEIERVMRRDHLDLREAIRRTWSITL
ncbi:MAG: glycosyltransferase family 2 protein [Phycisphaeraceae bacterium]